MNKELIFIHGGQAWSDYEAFLAHLQTTELWNVLSERPKRWKDTLRAELGSGYDIYLPSMPNSDNAKYLEWKLWFERYLALVHDGVVLVGHSQGGYFLLKYLSEETLPVRPAALVLVAAPAEPDDFGGEDGGDFAFDQDKLPSVAAQVDRVCIFHSRDDEVVPYRHAEVLAAALPGATLKTFEDRGHFLEATFPELIEEIRALA